MPRWKERPKLTDEQRVIAAADENIRVAKGVAARFCRSYYWLGDEFMSIAGWGLCIAAQGFTSDRATQKGFRGYLAAVVRSLCWEVVRFARPLGYRNVEEPGQIPRTENAGRFKGDARFRYFL